MNKYEKLKNYVSSIALEYQNKFEIAKKDFESIGYNENTEKWYAIAQRLQECLNTFVYAKKKEIRLNINEQEIREKLEGFHSNNGYIYDSYVYRTIFKDSYICIEPVYHVGNKNFKTLEEAKEYSISLGEDKNWLKNAYNYL